MEGNHGLSGGLKAGDGMGDFMRFTTDAPLAEMPPVHGANGLAHAAADELATHRLHRIGKAAAASGGNARQRQ